MDRLIKKAELLELVGASYPTIWRWMRDGAFPRSVILGPNRVAWRESEVREWLEGLARGGPKPRKARSRPRLRLRGALAHDGEASS